MSEDKSKNRLGRGLAALIGEMDDPAGQVGDTDAAETSKITDRFVPIETISQNINNPRRDFDNDDLEDLANSIKVHGVVQPILVRAVTGTDSERWEIVAGERRWRAAQKAGLHDVPVVVRDVDDRQALELAIIENVQRADLNPIEEAVGYQRLLDEHDYTQQELAGVIGKSRSHVANTLRLMKLPDAVRDLVRAGDLSSGHARALITMDAPESLAQRIVQEGLSVREVERLAALGGEHPGETNKGSSTRVPKSTDTMALEKRLSDHLGLNVRIDHKPNDGGKLTVSYRSLDQLDNLAQKLAR